jgi:hypothetical protein
MFTLKKQTVEPGDAFENVAFQQWFENVEGCREAALHLNLCNRNHQQIPGINKLIQIGAISIFLYQH